MRRLIVLFPAILLFSACGGGTNPPADPDSETTVPAPSTRSGMFIDSPVDGIEYSSDGGNTRLIADGGNFTYEVGDTVTFMIGDIVLGSAGGSAYLMPRDIAPSRQAAINMARFLQTLDSDGDPDNGIQLSVRVRQAASGHAFTAKDFDVDDATFESSAIADFARTANGDERELRSRHAAEAEMACNEADVDSDGGFDGVCQQKSDQSGRILRVHPGPNATIDARTAFLAALPGDTIEFGCGYFEINETLILQSTENIRIRGCGINKTVLNFEDSSTAEGVLAINVDGLWIDDLTILDSPGDAFKLKGVDHGILTRVRAMWSGKFQPVTAENFETAVQVPCTAPPPNEEANQAPLPDYNPDPDAGRYGIYPVQSENIVLDGVESVGASDAGIYVGQTNNAIIKNSRAVYNVMGYEIENTQGGEYVNNLAECNVGGFLVYDLEGLSQYGEGVRVHGNRAINNNTYNFTSLGGFIAAVPRGSGFIFLANDRVDMYNNHVENHDTAGVIIVSYELLGGQSDNRLDGYVEGLLIRGNTFINNGSNPPEPRPAPSGRQSDTEARALPSLVRAKNQGVGAHILWDGYYDELNADCELPKQNNGEPVPTDERGKPIYVSEHPNPACLYNKYKFDDSGNRKMPDWYICIEPDSNSFGPVDSGSNGVPNYANFHGVDGVLNDKYENYPADRDMSVHDCVNLYGRNPEPPPEAVVIEPFAPSKTIDPKPTDEQVALLCGRELEAGEINRAAFGVDCPDLANYNLFADSQDPRSTPNEGGLPFVMNSKLFSDYAVKYRVAFVPPNTPATWRDARDGINQMIQFPVGTVLAKTFAFRDGDSEQAVETRLLIKRENSGGQVRWDGLPYIWADEEGKRVARLARGGGTATVSWNYADADSGTQLIGSTENYGIPNANQCITCHGNDDVTAGAAPIGPKPRHLNRGYKPESDFMGTEGQAGYPQGNQLKAWIDARILKGGPADLGINPETQVAANVEHLPRWNVPGDSGHSAGSNEDIEARTRAYFEINCQHCHNVRGVASNTGLFLDSFRTVDRTHGICKTPTAAGGGTGGRSVVIRPGDVTDSIVSYRMQANDAEGRMPPIARSTAHVEAVALVNQWISTVVDYRYINPGYPEATCEQTSPPEQGGNEDPGPGDIPAP